MKVEQRGDLAVVRVSLPRLDAAAAPGFRAEMLALVERGRHRMILDLSATEFLDSIGLGTMVSLLKALGPGGDLAVAGAQPRVRKLFALTRLDRVFRLFETAEDAERALAAG
ncbi:MAG: STAS domain-containing protein [Acetobacteraceae bacterium]|nr:STAS domain-containing protein [Acetobacteraceae bacterium]